jgi:hypothetical protein
MAERGIVSSAEWHEDLRLRQYLEKEGLIEYADGKWCIGDGRPRSEIRDDDAAIPTDMSYHSTQDSVLEHLFRPDTGQRALASPILQDDESLAETESSYSDVSMEITPPESPQTELLHKLMTAFSTLFHKNLQHIASAILAVQQYKDGNGNSIKSASSTGGSRAGEAPSSNGASGKRKRAGQEDDDNDELGGDANGGNKSRRTKPTGSDAPTIKFACLFYKRNPVRYKTSRSCPGPGWDSVHRLKLVQRT